MNVQPLDSRQSLLTETGSAVGGGRASGEQTLGLTAVGTAPTQPHAPPWLGALSAGSRVIQSSCARKTNQERSAHQVTRQPGSR